jgi:hypothetical protein
MEAAVVGKENVVHIYNGVFFSHKKNEIVSFAGMDGIRDHYVK